MSLNTAHANGGVLIYAGERILLYCDGVEMGFEGVKLPHFKGNKKGRLYLTTHRVIFNNDSSSDMLKSFSIPFLCMKEVELEQPIFGANFIKGKVQAEQGGNWEGITKFKLWFNHGGAIEFGQAMLRAGQLASRNRVQQPPPYMPPMGNVYQAPPPAYAPPQSGYYDWVPYQTFPSAPPPEYVYMTEAPPPYPGVDPSAPYPPPQHAPYQQANGYNSNADDKAREAAASAYYNPNTPHNVHMVRPPSYDEVTKKNN